MRIPSLTYSVPDGADSGSISPALYVGTIAPDVSVAAAEGSLFIDTAANSIYIRDADAWHVLTGGGGTPVTWSDITGNPNTNPDLVTLIEEEAADAVDTHVAQPNPHPIYLTEAEADALYDAIGAALAAVAAHEAAPDPHPQYLTEAEGDARYASISVTGTQGPPGLDGADGAEGEPGPPGATGATGATMAGPPGMDGAEGADGEPGAPGATGATGATGAQGPPGLDGADGAEGQPGPPGPTGATGPAGGGGSALQVTLTLPYPAKHSHVISVVDATVATTSKITAGLAGSDDNSTNGSNMTDLLQLVGQPKTGSIDFKLNFLTPTAGPFLVNYSVAA